MSIGPGVTCPKRIAIGSCLRMSSRQFQYAGYDAAEVKRALKRKEEPSYQGTFTGVRRYVLQTFANTQSPLMKKRVAQYMISSECPLCHGKRLRSEALSVKFAGLDVAEISR